MFDWFSKSTVGLVIILGLAAFTVAVLSVWMVRDTIKYVFKL